MKSFEVIIARVDQKLETILKPDWLTGKWASFLLLITVAVVGTIRLYTIGSPAIDRTDWKEIDHIMISENYYKNGYRFLYPEVAWPAEPPRATAMELPVAPFLASLLYPIFGINAYSVRMLTFISFLLLIFYTFKLVKRETGIILALSAALLTGLLPLSNQFNRYLFSEPLLLLCSVFSIYYYAEWMDTKKSWQLILFVVGFSLALSLKPTSLYLGLPFLWIHFRKYGFSIKKYLSFIIAMAICLILPVWWYLHAYHLADNYIDVFGVFGGQFGGHNKFQTITMLSDMDWWITMYFRMKRMLLGNFGLLMLFIGVLTCLILKKGRLLFAYLVSVILFFMIVAEGNLDTTYRQLTIIPSAAFFIALGTITTIILMSQFLQELRFNENTGNMLATTLTIGLLLIFPLKRYDIYTVAGKEVPVHPNNWLLAKQIKQKAPKPLK
jgi:4-amino-4-deoxy-L-arabinose transferase-like glycosyltransferase